MTFKSSTGRIVVGIALAGSAMALAGCQSTTYGTGKSPGMQTVEDLAGIAMLGTPNEEPIEYRPRAGIVTPPNAGVLPPPGSGQPASALAANWPNDPDAQRARIRAEAAERERTGAAMPNLNLPRSAPTAPVVMRDASREAMGTPESKARARQMFADARGGLAVDENGVPVRRYITDPPSEYRVPDPNAPVEVVEKPKQRKFKWFWEK